MSEKKDRPLTAKQERFPAEYIKDLCATDAARRAGYSDKSAKQIGHELLHDPRIAARIAALSAERSTRTGITADRVLEELFSIATADPRELIESRIGACRYCHGLDFMYQRTPAERLKDHHHWRTLSRAARKKHRHTTITGEFDEMGGVGFDSTKTPVAGCPECHGLGERYVVVKDERHLSDGAARLLAGVKETKDGIEVKMHDKSGALQMIGRHLKLFTDVVQHEGLEGLTNAMRAAEERLANADR